MNEVIRNLKDLGADTSSLELFATPEAALRNAGYQLPKNPLSTSTNKDRKRKKLQRMKRKAGRR